MRKIKFRAWFDGHMCEVAKLDFWGDPDQATCDMARMSLTEYGNVEEIFDVYLNEVELMQYTGLKDKNGVEIFEGDIVKMYCSFKDIYGTSLETHEDEITIIGVVRIDMTTGMYLEVDDETENYYWHEFYRDPAEHFEIIGNVFENPELLEGDNE